MRKAKRYLVFASLLAILGIVTCAGGAWMYSNPKPINPVSAPELKVHDRLNDITFKKRWNDGEIFIQHPDGTWQRGTFINYKKKQDD